MGLLIRMVTWLAWWPLAALSIWIRSLAVTLTPISAMAPFTLTQPLAIHSSASRREHMFSSAMRLFRRVGSLLLAAVPAAPVGGAARRKGTGGFEGGKGEFINAINVVATCADGMCGRGCFYIHFTGRTWFWVVLWGCWPMAWAARTHSPCEFPRPTAILF